MRATAWLSSSPLSFHQHLPIFFSFFDLGIPSHLILPISYSCCKYANFIFRLGMVIAWFVSRSFFSNGGTDRQRGILGADLTNDELDFFFSPEFSIFCPSSHHRLVIPNIVLWCEFFDDAKRCFMSTIASVYHSPLVHLSAPAHQLYCRCPPTRDYHLVSLISPPLLTLPGRWIELVPDFCLWTASCVKIACCHMFSQNIQPDQRQILQHPFFWKTPLALQRMKKLS